MTTIQEKIKNLDSSLFPDKFKNAICGKTCSRGGMNKDDMLQYIGTVDASLRTALEAKTRQDIQNEFKTSIICDDLSLYDIFDGILPTDIIKHSLIPYISGLVIELYSNDNQNRTYKLRLRTLKNTGQCRATILITRKDSATGITTFQESKTCDGEVELSLTNVSKLVVQVQDENNHQLYLERMPPNMTKVDFGQLETFIVPPDCTEYFNGQSRLTTVENMRTSHVKSMRKMFLRCSMFNQPVKFDTSSVTNMSGMFSWCTKFNQPVEFDTSSVTTMSYMFNHCTSFNQPVKFDTGKVSDMSWMFYKCTNFNQSVEFEMSNVTHIESMFDGTALESKRFLVCRGRPVRSETSSPSH